jgi:competence protein ComEC
MRGGYQGLMIKKTKHNMFNKPFFPMRDFRIFFFKVGNGHCSYVEFPNGENALIDLKVSKESNDENVIEILNNAKIHEINHLIITHPHQDHIGGLSELMRNFSVREFIFSPIYFEPDPIYDDWNIYELMKKGKHCNRASEVKKGWFTTVGDCTIHYLAPYPDLLKSQPEKINNNGLVLKINATGHNIIIPGDIETDGWEYINDGDLKNTSLLLASHHGNNSGYNLNKLKIMNPGFVVISAGPKTEYDADQKYRNNSRNGVFTTRMKRIVATIDKNDHNLRIT